MKSSSLLAAGEKLRLRFGVRTGFKLIRFPENLYLSRNALPVMVNLARAEQDLA